MLNSKASRVVWSVNGYLLLILLVAGIIALGSDLLPRLTSDDSPHERGALVGEASEVAQALEVSPQHLEYDRPQRVAESPFYVSSVYVVDREIAAEVLEAIESAGDISRNMIGARINALFFSGERGEAYPMLDRVAYIARVELPQHMRSRGASTESLPEHLLFEIAMEDTNGDQRINDSDRSAFYLSDYSGKDLRQITPDSLKLDDYWYSPDGSGIFFEEVIVGETERVYGMEYTLDERRLYHYDLASDVFEPFTELQEAFEQVKQQYGAGS